MTTEHEPPMLPPDDGPNSDADENLDGLTDEGWLEAHHQLRSKMAIPDSEFAYIWAPGETPEEAAGKLPGLCGGFPEPEEGD